LHGRLPDVIRCNDHPTGNPLLGAGAVHRAITTVGIIRVLRVSPAQPSYNLWATRPAK
jgi:hypothetical protein